MPWSGRSIDRPVVEEANIQRLRENIKLFQRFLAPDPLTLANSSLCSGSTRPGIETRYLEQAACLRIRNPVQICVPFRG